MNNIPDYQMAEIKRKAGLGEKMQIDTPEKIAAYNSFASADNNPYAPKPAQPSFDMNAFNSSMGEHIGSLTNNFNTQFSQMQGMYDSRMSALEKMLGDMQNKNKYLGVQGAQNLQQGGTSGVGDGTHIFEPSGAQSENSNVGYTQGENATNQALFKYLQGMWNGGF